MGDACDVDSEASGTSEPREPNPEESLPPNVAGNTVDTAATNEICDNGLDDDGAEAVDSADGDCAGEHQAPDNIEFLPFEAGECGFQDVWGHPCWGDSFGTSSTSERIIEQPGLVGRGDSPDISVPTEKHEGICGDGIDNDGDALVDEEDSDCKGVPIPCPLIAALVHFKQILKKRRRQPRSYPSKVRAPSQSGGQDTAVVRHVPNAPIRATLP